MAKTKKKEEPQVFKEVEINEKEANRISQHGFGSIIFYTRNNTTPQKGDILNFRVLDGLYVAPWSPLHDVGAVVINSQVGLPGLENGYALVTFVLGDESLRKDDDVNE